MSSPSNAIFNDKAKKRRAYTPVNFHHAAKKKDDKNSIIADMKKHIQIIQNEHPNCLDALNHRKSTINGVQSLIPTKCNCKHQLNENGVQEVAEFLAEFALYNHEIQKRFMIEWMKGGVKVLHIIKTKSLRHDTLFNVPGLSDAHILICKQTLARLTGFGSKKWDTCWKIANGRQPESEIIHGLKGRDSNNKMKGYTIQKLEDFFQHMHQLAEPRATRVVRTYINETVTTTLRDTDEEIVELPSHMTKRALYKRFIKEKFAIDIEFTGDGRIRLKNDRSTTTSSIDIPSDLPSWMSFLNYWSDNHKKLVIQKPSKDICGECYEFCNKFRMRANKTDEMLNDNNNNEPQETNRSIEMIIQEEQQLLKLVQKAERHVIMAQVMREIYNKIRNLSFLQFSIGVQWKFMILSFVMDYSQNLNLPSFAGVQPGETYYYSPMNVYMFGIYSFINKRLNAFTYLEGEAKKGGNNVASLIINFLKETINELRKIREDSGENCDGPISAIYLFFDNCGGQNKNKFVVRLLNLLVLSGVCKSAYAMFLVRGHTKNDCDRMFNLVKINYRKKNIYTPDQMIEELNDTHESIKATMVNANIFFDYGKFQDKFLNGQVQGVSKNHVFMVSENEPYIINMKEAWDSPTYTKMNMKKTKNFIDPGQFDVFNLGTDVLPQLQAPGIRDIKRIELYDKFGPLIEEKYKNSWEFYSHDPGKDLRRKVTTDKKLSKQLKEKVTTKGNKDDDNDSKGTLNAADINEAIVSENGPTANTSTISYESNTYM